MSMRFHFTWIYILLFHFKGGNHIFFKNAASYLFHRVSLNVTDVWLAMERNWDHFFWLTGETPHSLRSLVNKIQAKFVPNFYQMRRSRLDLKNQVCFCAAELTATVIPMYLYTPCFCTLFQILVTMIFLRQYPTMQNLSVIFGIPVSCIHKIIHKWVRILHTYLVPKYIRWHSMAHWRRLAGSYPEWPRVVAIVDCTPFRISKPKGFYYLITIHVHY